MSDETKAPGPAASPPATPRDAATILLVRDGTAGLEIFMMVRHKRMDFASGAMVFPGGGVDPHDRDPGLRIHLPAGMQDMDETARALRVAAIREAYEECGVLLARETGAEALVDAARLTLIDRRYEAARRRHNLDMERIAREESLELAVDLLVPFAHWITPTPQPKRFDTRFYIAEAPADHVAVHDGWESVESVWMRPEQICAEADQGHWQVMFPTRMNLERLAASATVAEALAAARAAEVVPVLPEVKRTDGGRHLTIPHAAGYGVSEVIVDKKGNIFPQR